MECLLSVLEREVDTSAELDKTLIGVLVTNHGQLVAYLDVIVSDEELTGITSSTPS